MPGPEKLQFIVQDINDESCKTVCILASSSKRAIECKFSKKYKKLQHFTYRKNKNKIQNSEVKQSEVRFPIFKRRLRSGSLRLAA